MIDMPMERLHPHLSRGHAYVEFETPEEAEKALKHMDGGWWNNALYECSQLCMLIKISTTDLIVKT